MDKKILEKIIRETIEDFFNTPYVKIGISNRHAHLSREDINILFGEGYKLTPIKNLLPGQYSCDETITIIGSKGTIERVRILGPERNQSQVEISLTDSFKIGEKISVSESGDLKSAKTITLMNPKNGRSVEKKCAIAALRHIHSDLEFAKKFNLKDKQIVSVQFEGIRKITFDNVLVRISKDYDVEMHIDTDEANAGFIKNGDFGRIII